MKEKAAPGPVGVIVARFQVSQLHAGHMHLISHVRERHEDVLIVLGVRRGVRTRRDPLTFAERLVMLEQSFPDQKFTVVPLEDHPFSSVMWSQSLDALIQRTFPGRSAILYGARDSFIPHYTTGVYATQEVRVLFPNSGTLARKSLEFPNTADARAAIIYEMEHRPPFMYATSDLAIVDVAQRRVLLIGKKCHGGKLSFPGGHAEKTDLAAVRVAIREGQEEVLGVSTGFPRYIDTITIDDPRYKDTPDGVMTTFYMSAYLGGNPQPGDDADSVHWVAYEDLLEVLTPWHRPLGELLLHQLGH
ncbi:MAG: NUDIX domain-containing protein [Candidatus Paceibacterota bacterium]|jgi:ADP-ribose pyrophosphatase YjhB (NUDIX family)